MHVVVGIYLFHIKLGWRLGICLCQFQQTLRDLCWGLLYKA